MSSDIRPPTISELAKAALDSLWETDPSKLRELKHYVRMAEKLRKGAHECVDREDWEGAFIQYARAATLVMERIPEHPDYINGKVLNPEQRKNLSLNGVNMMERMAEIKAILLKRLADWDNAHPPLPDGRRRTMSKSSKHDAQVRFGETEILPTAEEHRRMVNAMREVNFDGKPAAPVTAMPSAMVASTSNPTAAATTTMPVPTSAPALSSAEMRKAAESDELRKAAADAADLRRAAALLAAQQAAAAGEEERSRLQRLKEEEDRIRAQEEERARHLRQQDEMRLREEEIRRKKEARKMKEAEFVRRQRDADDTARAVRQAIEVNNPGTVSSPFLPLDNPAFMYDGDTTDSDSPQQSSRRPIEYPIRMPSRGGSLSYPPPVTTASLPPAEARITYPSLMTQHQQRQGYDPGRGMPLPTPQPHHHHRPPAVVMDSSPIRPHQPWIPDPRTRPPPRVPSPSAPQSQSQAQAQQPRVTETPITKPKTPRLTRDGLRQVNLPREALSRFATIAQMNTKKNLETCGLLLGKDRGHKYVVTTLLIPKQHATSDTCTMDEEELVMLFTEKRGLITLGWIHTHPSQSCFMSSVDLHTHAGFQCMLRESFAVVCAPTSTPNVGIFRLTDPPGLETVLQCTVKEAFHPHPDVPIYTDADKGHVQMKDLPLEIVDLR